MTHSNMGFALPVFGALIVLMTVVGIAFTVFWILEIVDAAQRTFTDPNMKVVWMLIIILLGFLGALIYHFVGKKQGYLPGQISPTTYQ